jgi:branched-chain amino acid transport system substrate-binding protein
MNGSSNTRRRRFLQAAGATATMSAFAGCLPGDSDSGDAPEGPLNVVHLAPLSIFLGVGSQRCANMAVEDINENGGIQGDDVEIEHVDTANDPATAQEEVQRVLTEGNVDLFVGTYVSEVTQAIMDDIADENIPFIVTGSAAPSTVTDFIGSNYDQYKNFFRTGPINSNFQAEAMVSYANHLRELHGWESFAILGDDAAWNNPFMNTLPGALEEEGFDVAFEEALNINTEDFSPVINNILDADVDGIFRFWAHINGSAFLVERAQRQLEFGVEGIHVTGMHPSYIQLTEGAAMYETTSQSGGGGVAPITEKTQPFAQRYAERYADSDPPVRHPAYMGFNTFDALHFYKAATDEAGTWDYVNDLDSIVDGMTSISHTGVVGEIDLFGADGEYPHDAKPARDDEGTITNFPITQWQPGQDGPSLELVYPEQNATAEHMPPVWQ